MTTKVIQLENVSHTYSSQKSNSLSIADWSVEQGEHIFLKGESGSGKSTLLNLLSGVLEPDAGKVAILGQDLCKLSNAKKDSFRAKHIGVVFQTFNLIPYLSVLKNIELACYFAKTGLEGVRDKAKNLFEKLKLSEELLDRPVSQLSIGQQQRVAIVRALINEPELLLVDEPTSALDASARDAFLTTLTSTLQGLSTTMLFVSHDRSIEDYFQKSVDINSIISRG